MIPPWCNDYLSVPPIPFQDGGRDRTGLDCYGLVRLVFLEQFGIDLPSYAGAYHCIKDERSAIGMLVEEQAGVRTQWQKTDSPHCGTAVLFRWRGLPLHCGAMVTDQDFLHIESGSLVSLDSIMDLKWRVRLIGFYNYVG